MNSGAISFLQRQGFDFGKWMTHGIPYLSREEEALAKANMEANAKWEDMTLKPEDQPLIDHIRKTVAEWQAQPKVFIFSFASLNSDHADQAISRKNKSRT